VAQLEAQATCNRQVVGSSPTAGSRRIGLPSSIGDAGSSEGRLQFVASQGVCSVAPAHQWPTLGAARLLTTRRYLCEVTQFWHLAKG